MSDVVVWNAVFKYFLSTMKVTHHCTKGQDVVNPSPKKQVTCECYSSNGHVITLYKTQQSEAKLLYCIGLIFQMFAVHQKGQREPKSHKRPKKTRLLIHWEVRFKLWPFLYHYMTRWLIIMRCNVKKRSKAFYILPSCDPTDNPENIVKHVVTLSSRRQFVPISPAAIPQVVPITGIANFNTAALLPPSGGKCKYHDCVKTSLFFLAVFGVRMSIIDATHINRNIHTRVISPSLRNRKWGQKKREPSGDQMW